MVRYEFVVDDHGYRVGDDGSVWTRLKKVGLGDGGGVRYIPIGEWVQLKPTVEKSGHLQVRIRGKKKRVHTLVLEAFVGLKPDGMEARHFPDRNPANNSVENLSWGTHQQNIHDQKRHGTDNGGERNGQAKMMASDVLALREDVAGGMSCANAARKYNISRTQARRIVTKKRWAHL